MRTSWSVLGIFAAYVLFMHTVLVEYMITYRNFYTYTIVKTAYICENEFTQEQEQEEQFRERSHFCRRSE